MKDIFKSSFLEGYASTDINALTIAVCMLISVALGVYIYYAYRLLCKKQFYNKSFNIALPAILLITSAVVLTIQSNIVVSLGMVGALSIVRFRTAIKDPIDLVFLFWAISCGIICGSGVSQIAVVLSAVLTILVIVLYKLPGAQPTQILTINSTKNNIEEISDIVKNNCTYYCVKSKAVTAAGLDAVFEIKTDKDDVLLNSLLGLEGISQASILAHNGEVTF